jgi:uncharacterized protein YeaO (DUF488 family)
MERILTKRVYETPDAADGRRILVDRVWPRGMTKTRLSADFWLKSVAPSTELRNWFKHDRLKWKGFKKRYFLELDQNPEELATLIAAVKKGHITLLYSAKDTNCNQAVALKEYLSSRLATN